MGGFHYYKGSDLANPCHPVDPYDLLDLVNTAKIELPTVEEIQDQSKSGGNLGRGEPLIKALALLQVFWFSTQCIAKATGTSMVHSSQELREERVTKLEILTAAYIMMAFCMHVAWWNKPLNVTQPIRVSLSLEPTTGLHRRQRLTMAYEPPPSTSIQRYHRRYVEAAEDIIFGFSSNYAHFPNGKTVPRFYTGGSNPNNDRSVRYFFIVLLITAIFAAINCTSWSYDNNSALSFIDIALWRLSSFAGVGFWLISALGLIILVVMDWLRWIQLDSFYDTFCAWIISLLALISVLLRIASFLLAIRELNTSAEFTLDTTDWTYSIPHI
jgi:hypothetical protein